MYPKKGSLLPENYKFSVEVSTYNLHNYTTRWARATQDPASAKSKFLSLICYHPADGGCL